MKSKHILVLGVLVVAVGVGGLVLHRKQSESWGGGSASGEKLLGKLPVGESLAQISIRQGTNAVTLQKTHDAWLVKERGDYPANFSEMSSAIIKLRDLKPVQTEQIGASQLGRLELQGDTATRVEFRDAGGKVLESLVLGKTQMREERGASQFGGMDMGGFPVGRWVMLGEAKDVVHLVSDPLSNLSPSAGPWLNKDFFKVEKIRSITVTHPEATNSWSVSRTNETASDWILSDAKAGETLDSSKTSGFSYALSSPNFNDVVVNPNAEELGLDKPTTIKIETFDGFTYSLKTGAKTEGDMALNLSVSADIPKERQAGADEKPEDKTRLDKEFAEHNKTLSEKLAKEKAFEKWTYLVPSWTLESLLKNRGELLQEHKAGDEPANASSDEAGSPEAEHAHE